MFFSFSLSLLLDLLTDDLDFGDGAGTQCCWESLRDGDLEEAVFDGECLMSWRFLELDLFSVFGELFITGACGIAALGNVGLPLIVHVLRFDTDGLLERFLELAKNRLNLGVFSIFECASLASHSASDLPVTVRSTGAGGGSASSLVGSSSGSDVDAPLPGKRFSNSLA